MLSSSQKSIELTTVEKELLFQWGKELFSHEDYERVLLFLYRKSAEEASQIVEEMKKLLSEHKNTTANFDATFKNILKKQEKAEKIADSEEQALLLKNL